MRKVLIATSLVAMMASLSACGSRGIFNRDRPDEMAVSRQAPLVIPPDFALVLAGRIALVAALHDFPTALLIWLVAFLAYQQLQDRVVQPMLYGRAVQISPLVAILALLAGAQILGILGALLAIPVAASIGVVFSILRGEDDKDAEADVGVGSAQPSPSGG